MKDTFYRTKPRNRRQHQENIPSLLQEIPENAFDVIPPDGNRENRMFGSIHPGGKDDLHKNRPRRAS